jgi:hypothetical protein
MTHDGYREAFLVAFDGQVDKLKEANSLADIDKCLGDLWRLVLAPECLDPDNRENCVQTVNVYLTDALVRIHNAREAPQSQAA